MNDRVLPRLSQIPNYDIVIEFVVKFEALCDVLKDFFNAVDSTKDRINLLVAEAKQLGRIVPEMGVIRDLFISLIQMTRDIQVISDVLKSRYKSFDYSEQFKLDKQIGQLDPNVLCPKLYDFKTRQIIRPVDIIEPRQSRRRLTRNLYDIVIDYEPYKYSCGILDWIFIPTYTEQDAQSKTTADFVQDYLYIEDVEMQEAEYISQLNIPNCYAYPLLSNIDIFQRLPTRKQKWRDVKYAIKRFGGDELWDLPIDVDDHLRFIPEPSNLYCNDGDCVICSELLNDGNPKVMLPCGHCFHRTCITAWYKQKRECPLCHSEFRTARLIAPAQDESKSELSQQRYQELSEWALRTISKPEYVRDIDDERYLLSLSAEAFLWECFERLSIAFEAYQTRDLLYNDLLDEQNPRRATDIQTRIHQLTKLIDKANPSMLDGIAQQILA